MIGHQDKLAFLINAVLKSESLSHLSLKEWDELLRLARRSNLIGKIAESVETNRYMELLPTQVQKHLGVVLLLSKHQRQAIQWEMWHIGRALDSLDCPKVLLKGGAYSVAELNVSSGRLFGDIDLLVPFNNLPHVEAALMLHGWRIDCADSYDQRYYRQWMHEIPPMVHCDRGTVVDLHHNILPLTARTLVNIESLFENAIPSSVTGFLMLSPADMVLHSATHLFHESELGNGLRDLFDLKALIEQFCLEDKDFWSRLVHRAELTGLGWPLLLAATALKNNFGFNVPSDILVSIRQVSNMNAIQEQVLGKAYGLALQSVVDDKALSSKLAKFFVYIRGHYLRMPFNLLTPHLTRKFFGRLYKSSNRRVENPRGRVF